MKNFIILVLLAALAYLSYLHFFKDKPIDVVAPENTKTIELGKDSIKISYYIDERIDSTNIDKPLEGETKRTKMAASNTLPTLPCVPEAGKDCPDLAAVLCCHLPPPNVIPSLNNRLNIFSNNLIKGIKVEVVKGR